MPGWEVAEEMSGREPTFCCSKDGFLGYAERTTHADSLRERQRPGQAQSLRQAQSALGDDRHRGSRTSMALQIDEIRRLAERVAGSHHLEVVDVEFGGGGKSRALRVYLEKDAAERAKLKERVAAASTEEERAALELPSGVPVELLSGVTHEDCATFATDFGTLLDVEDVVPGGEYTLEVSSPGLERRLTRAEEYERFTGSLVKLKLFVPVRENKVWTGRLIGFADGVVRIDLAAVKQKGKKTTGSRDQGAGSSVLEVPLKDVEKANLVAEI